MNVGDYVRTPKGIGKVESIEIDKQDTIIHLDCGITIDYITKDFAKEEINKMYPSNSQIIDLIEIGDYVNGLPVIRIYNESEKYDNSSYKFSMKVVEVKNDNYETIPFEDIFKNEEIKTVLTHEQMEAMQYRVEE